MLEIRWRPHIGDTDPSPNIYHKLHVHDRIRIVASTRGNDIFESIFLSEIC